MTSESQQTLFQMPVQPPQPTPLERRHEAMEAALKYAGEKFKESFTAFVIQYLERHGKSSGEAIREAYERTTNPRPVKGHWQCVGGIYARLRKEGKVVEVGKVRSKKFGNDISVIELVK